MSEGHNYEIAGIRYRDKDPLYTHTDVLMTIGENSQIIKKWTSGEPINETRYSYIQDGKEIVYIRGTPEKSGVFHIGRIENTTENNVNSVQIPKVFSHMEADLKKQGIKKLTTNAIVKLAPILVKRYGFKYTDNVFVKLDTFLGKIIPGKTLSLEKELLY